MRLSLVLPNAPAVPEQAEQPARLVSESPLLERLWQGQSYGVDTATTFSHLAGRGIRPALGTGVMLTTLQHPVRAALEARSLAVISGQPVMYCVGPGSRNVQSLLRGSPDHAPVASTRRYLDDMRSTLVAAVPGDHARDTESPLLYVIPTPEVRIGVGVLRPAMAEVAGSSADVAMSWLGTPEYLRDQLIPPMESSAARATRPRPHLVAAVHVAVARRGRDARRLAHLGIGGHLALAHYAATARRCGAAVEPGNDSATAEAALSSGLFVYGSATEIAERMRAYARCGIDEIALHIAAVAACHGVDEALDDVREILSEWSIADVG
ncbi:LLM class flavin-dependent oxidoreductase [Nocardia jiangxiensis]|uniref:LLM class flavin-dependent oxidoreductase n=1 Tax=Nocardia jiangxiensis TaxID=282685 RepID=UPI0002F768FB|nr:LLM class flavin-dependent oxidoreductase [Nocardia jiangxiensis]